MKTIKKLSSRIAMIALLLCSIQMNAQKTNENVIEYDEFLNLISGENVSTNRGTICQTFNVTTSILGFEIETSVMFCCTSTDNGVPYCAWLPSNKSEFKTDKDGYFAIKNSSTIHVNGYAITIKKGTYRVDPKTQKPNIQFITIKI